MEVLHSGRTEDNEKTHPQCGALERNDFVGLALFGFVIGFENYRIEEKGDEAKHEEQFDEKDDEVFRVMLNAATGLGCQNLIDIVKVDPARKQQHDEQNAGHFFIVLVEDIRNGFDLFLWHGLLEPRRDRHDEKGEPADPYDRRQQMKPVVNDRDERIEIGEDTLESVHLLVLSGKC